MPCTSNPKKARRDRRTISGRKRIDREPRSRSGCITCRARHKRCDQQSPVCGNCWRLNIKCAGYACVLRWQDSAMRTAHVKDTQYSSIRYINFQSGDYENYGDEVDHLMELYAPFDALTEAKTVIRPPLDLCAITDGRLSTSHYDAAVETNAVEHFSAFSEPVPPLLSTYSPAEYQEIEMLSRQAVCGAIANEMMQLPPPPLSRATSSDSVYSDSPARIFDTPMLGYDSDPFDDSCYESPLPPVKLNAPWTSLPVDDYFGSGPTLDVLI